MFQVAFISSWPSKIRVQYNSECTFKGHFINHWEYNNIYAEQLNKFSFVVEHRVRYYFIALYTTTQYYDDINILYFYL